MGFNAVDSTKSYDMVVIEDAIFAEMDEIDILEQHKQPPLSEGCAINGDSAISMFPTEISDSTGSQTEIAGATANATNTDQCMGVGAIEEACSSCSMSEVDGNTLIVLEVLDKDEQEVQDPFSSPPLPMVLFESSSTNSAGIQKRPPPGPDLTMIGSLWLPGLDPGLSPPQYHYPTMYHSSECFDGTVQDVVDMRAD